MPEQQGYVPQALKVYRRTLGDAADNEPVVLTGDVFADAWIEELEAYRAVGEAAEAEQLGEALDFAAALKQLDTAEAEVVFAGRSSRPGRAAARTRVAWSYGTG